jgi:hypothetical protein
MNRTAWFGAVLMSAVLTSATMIPADAFAADPLPLTEDECQAVVEPAKGPAEARDLDGVVVLDEKASSFQAPTFEDAKVKTIVCWRSAARFVESDRRVADAGLRLAVKAQGGAKDGEDRALVLEKVNGGFRIRALQGGEFAPEERKWIVELLQKLNDAKNLPTFVGTEKKT